MLPAREFALATLLFRNLGRILTKDFLSLRIWGWRTVNTTPAWPPMSAICARRWACGRATAS